MLFAHAWRAKLTNALAPRQSYSARSSQLRAC
jgi:hypothetical protein